MPRVIAILIIPVLVLVSVRAEDASAPKLNDELRKELLAMMKADQDARFKLIELMKQGAKIEKDKPASPEAEAVAELDQKHTRRMFQKKCLPLLEAAVKKKEASGQQLAYLTDRVSCGEGKKQRYGTQLKEVDGKMVPQPLEDEANIDKIRAEIGLQPLAEYLKLATETYKGKPTDKK